MKIDQFEIPLKFEHKVYFKQTGDDPKRIYLFLHGYLLDGKLMMDQLLSAIPKNALVIAPNGAFPVPVKKKERFSMQYAWYYFDPYTKNYYINFDPAAEFIKNILKQYPDLPVTVIGYSQGGYLSPKVAEVCEQVDSVIGLCCTFRNNRFVQKDIPYFQINSSIDKIVDIEESRSEFQKILNNKGRMIELDNTGHKLSPEINHALKDLLVELNF